jgi:hypothetical protein
MGFDWHRQWHVLRAYQLWLRCGFQRKNNSTEMKTPHLLSMLCLIGQSILFTCKQKETIPEPVSILSINDVIGEYECKVSLFDSDKQNVFYPTKRFTILKSIFKSNELEVDIEYGSGFSPEKESWFIEYNNGELFMPLQAISKHYLGPSSRDNPSDSAFAVLYQSALGTASANNLYIEALRHYEARNSADAVYKYWAKKK